jgi:hypothetical protein
MSASTENETAEATPEEQKPLLRVVSPHATPEEIAVITAVFAAMGSGGAAPVNKRPSDWASPARRVRRTLPHGLGGWKASALPR